MGHLTSKPENTQTIDQAPVLTNSHKSQQPTVEDREDIADIFKMLKKWDEESKNKMRTT